MKTRINIAEILRNKPRGIKLYSPIFGDCTYCYIHDETSDICVKKQYNVMIYFNFEGLYDTAGECLLFPSKEMRDWSKFAWKKGDILVGVGQIIIFEKFIDENYTEFQGKYSLSTYEDETLVANKRCYTSDFKKLDDNVHIKNYFKEIEEKLGGKLNRETLEVKKQPEFKDGDIVVTDAVPSMWYSKCIFILKGDLNTGESRANSYVFFNINNNHISYDVLDTIEKNRNIHFATDSEKQQLFGAIKKDGKAWDAEKKQIVDLKPKYEFKPFDKVLGRNEKYEVWEADFFSYYREESQYPFRCIGFNRKYCIPYNEETSHLLGTTDEWKGGEQ
ncbi:MAG: hypothetical protein U0L64_00105 [Clostridium sp.]|nr:hypothetical protein [Clostridium sp.]